MSDVGKAIANILANGTTSEAPYPGHADPETYSNDRQEYITYQLRNVDPSDTKSGVSTLDEVEVEIICYGISYPDLLTLAAKVRADLDRVSYGTYDGVELNGVQFLTSDGDYDEITGRHEIEQVYIIRVKNPV
jgi:hypothetical protein